MDDPLSPSGNGDREHDSTGGRRRRAGSFPAARAGAVLVLFVVATVLLLATIHQPRSAAVNAAVSTSKSTSTTSTTAAATAHSGRSRTGHHATTTTTTRPSADVPVLVANGSGVNGAAAAFTARLQAAGWTALTPTNATVDVPNSHVYYVAGQEPAAAAVAADIGIPPSSVAAYTTAVPVGSIGTADVVVVLGPDIATSATVSTAPTTTTTTTASSATG